MAENEDHNYKILQLLQHPDEGNVELAFHLCAGLEGAYSEEVAQELQKHVFLCVQHQLEPEFIQNLRYLSLWKDELTVLPPEVIQLPNLRQLNLGYNKLTTIPA